MNQASIIRSALKELLEECKTERVEWLNANSSAEGESVAEQLEYLGLAEAELESLAESADSEECSAVARKVLASVALFRTCLQRGDGTCWEVAHDERTADLASPPTPNSPDEGTDPVTGARAS